MKECILSLEERATQNEDKARRERRREKTEKREASRQQGKDAPACVGIGSGGLNSGVWMVCRQCKLPRSL